MNNYYSKSYKNCDKIALPQMFCIIKNIKNASNTDKK